MNHSSFAPAVRRARINRTLLSAIALSLLAAACSAPHPTATPMPPTHQIPDTPQPATPSPLPPRPNVKFEPQPVGVVAPIVIQRLPEAGERLRPEGVIELTFDRAMNQDSVATALKLQPAVQGAITWKDARTLSFTPAQALPRDTIIDVALTQEAKAADGAALAEPAYSPRGASIVTTTNSATRAIAPGSTCAVTGIAARAVTISAIGVQGCGRGRGTIEITTAVAGFTGRIREHRARTAECQRYCCCY